MLLLQLWGQVVIYDLHKELNTFKIPDLSPFPFPPYKQSTETGSWVGGGLGMLDKLLYVCSQLERCLIYSVLQPCY